MFTAVLPGSAGAIPFQVDSSQLFVEPPQLGTVDVIRRAAAKRRKAIPVAEDGEDDRQRERRARHRRQEEMAKMAAQLHLEWRLWHPEACPHTAAGGCHDARERKRSLTLPKDAAAVAHRSP